MKRFIFTGIIVFLLDIISKQFVSHFLMEHESISVISHFFSITYVKNTGVAFSMLQGNILFIIVISVLVIGIIFYFFQRQIKSYWEEIFYGMILGGALGNLIDRLFYGYVIDFFDFHLLGYSMAIFNVADIFIVCGVILLFGMEFWKERKVK